MYPGGRPCIQKCHSSFPSLPLGTTITPSTTAFAAETQSVCFVPSCFSFLWVPRHPSHVLHSSLTGKGGCVRFLFNPSPQPRLICYRLKFLEHGFGQHIAAVATFLATNYKHYQSLSTRHRFTRYQARLTFFCITAKATNWPCPSTPSLSQRSRHSNTLPLPVARRRVASLCFKSPAVVLQQHPSHRHAHSHVQSQGPKDPIHLDPLWSIHRPHRFLCTLDLAAQHCLPFPCSYWIKPSLNRPLPTLPYSTLFAVGRRRHRASSRNLIRSVATIIIGNTHAQKLCMQLRTAGRDNKVGDKKGQANSSGHS